MDGHHVTRFREKPAGDGALINGGFFVLSPKVLDYIDADETSWELEPMERRPGRANSQPTSIGASGNRWTRSATSGIFKHSGTPERLLGRAGEVRPSSPQPVPLIADHFGGAGALMGVGSSLSRGGGRCRSSHPVADESRPRCSDVVDVLANPVGLVSRQRLKMRGERRSTMLRRRVRAAPGPTLCTLDRSRRSLASLAVGRGTKSSGTPGAVAGSATDGSRSRIAAMPAACWSRRPGRRPSSWSTPGLLPSNPSPAWKARGRRRDRAQARHRHLAPLDQGRELRLGPPVAACQEAARPRTQGRTSAGVIRLC